MEATVDKSHSPPFFLPTVVLFFGPRFIIKTETLWGLTLKPDFNKGETGRKVQRSHPVWTPPHGSWESCSLRGNSGTSGGETLNGSFFLILCKIRKRPMLVWLTLARSQNFETPCEERGGFKVGGKCFGFFSRTFHTRSLPHFLRSFLSSFALESSPFVALAF